MLQLLHGHQLKNTLTLVSHLNNLIAGGRGEAAIVPVEGAHVPCQQAGDGEGGRHSFRLSSFDLVHVRKQTGQARVGLVRHLVQLVRCW